MSSVVPADVTQTIARLNAIANLEDSQDLRTQARNSTGVDMKGLEATRAQLESEIKDLENQLHEVSKGFMGFIRSIGALFGVGAKHQASKAVGESRRQAQEMADGMRAALDAARALLDKAMVQIAQAQAQVQAQGKAGLSEELDEVITKKLEPGEEIFTDEAKRAFQRAREIIEDIQGIVDNGLPGTPEGKGLFDLFAQSPALSSVASLSRQEPLTVPGPLGSEPIVANLPVVQPKPPDPQLTSSVAPGGAGLPLGDP